MTALGRFKTATESGANVKADILRVLGKNPRGRNSKEVITGSEFFASWPGKLLHISNSLFPFWRRSLLCLSSWPGLVLTCSCYPICRDRFYRYTSSIKWAMDFFPPMYFLSLRELQKYSWSSFFMLKILTSLYSLISLKAGEKILGPESLGRKNVFWITTEQSLCWCTFKHWNGITAMTTDIIAGWVVPLKAHI